MEDFRERIDRVVTEIVEDYNRGRVVDKLELFSQPDRVKMFQSK